MKLKKIILENFRGYKDRTYIEIEDFTAIIGRNDVGKSTLLEALDIFFENSKPDQGDGCINGDVTKVRIGCVFTNYPDSIVIDSTNPTSLASEYLLNSENQLEIHKLFNCSLSKPKCETIIAYANHPTNTSCSELLSMTNPKLKTLARELGVDLTTIDQTKNSELRNAIRLIVDNLQIELSEVSLNKEAGAKAWEGITKHLPIYALFKSDRPSSDQDSEAQDPMRAAIKIAVQEQQENLIALTEEVKLKVQEIADLTVQKLRDFSPDLANSLNPTVTTKSWDSLFNVSLADENDISVNKRGSGIRRLILLNFFRAKAEILARTNNAKIIYAIEEPETSQHPHNQKLLIETLQELVEDYGCQIIITTHTPMLVKSLPLSSVRYIKKVEGIPSIRVNDENSLNEIANELGVLPDHNVKCFFGVEGKHDIAFLKSISKIVNSNDNSVPNLEVAETNGHLIFIPLGGSNLELWVSRMNGLNKPLFYLMDRDTQPPEPAKYQNQFEAFLGEGHTAWITNKKELENYLHHSLITSLLPIYEGDGGNFEDVPQLLAKATHLSDTSPGRCSWEEVLDDSDKLKKKESSAKRRLNNEIVNSMTTDLLLETDPNGEVISWLRAIGAALI